MDATNPTSTISAPVDNTNTTDTTPQLTFTLTDNVDSTPAYAIYVDDVANGQSGTVTNNTATNLNLTALSEGTRSIVVVATDDTGNTANSTALTLTVDVTNPSATIIAPAKQHQHY